MSDLERAVRQALGDPEHWSLRSAYDAILAELDQIGELWLEYRAAGRDPAQVNRAISQATAESRRLERKARKTGLTF